MSWLIVGYQAARGLGKLVQYLQESSRTPAQRAAAARDYENWLAKRKREQDALHQWKRGHPFVAISCGLARCGRAVLVYPTYLGLAAGVILAFYLHEGIYLLVGLVAAVLSPILIWLLGIYLLAVEEMYQVNLEFRRYL
jgi:hypothetical protein